MVGIVTHKIFNYSKGIFNMKKKITRVLSIVLIIITIFSTSTIGLTASAAKTYDPLELVKTAESYVGGKWAEKSCLNFVATMVQKTYGTKYNSKPCAYEYGTAYLDKTTKNDIPIGADVFFSGSNTYCGKHRAGHVGIYVGDGYMIHAWSGKVVKAKIDSITKSGTYKYRGWGWHGNMSFATSSTTSSTSVTTTLKTGTWYKFTNTKSNKLLNVYGSKSASNTNVTVYQKDGTSGQDFKLAAHGTMKFNGKTYTKYTILPRCASKCALNVYGSSSKNGSNVNIWTKSGNNTQDWIFEAVSGGYVIRSANNTSYVLTASGTSNSSNVKLATYSAGNKYQIWKFS